MTENEIEFIVEKTMDVLDSKLKKGQLKQADYDAEVAKLDNWSKQKMKNCLDRVG